MHSGMTHNYCRHLYMGPLGLSDTILRQLLTVSVSVTLNDIIMVDPKGQKLGMSIWKEITPKTGWIYVACRVVAPQICNRRRELCTDVLFTDLLHCALAAAQCIVIGPVCLFVGVCVVVCVGRCVCYHNNSKLRASILNKLGL